MAHEVIDSTGRLTATTFVDVDVDCSSADDDLAVVGPERRGVGLATAVKAYAVLDLVQSGVTALRTSGASENAATCPEQGSGSRWIRSGPPWRTWLRRRVSPEQGRGASGTSRSSCPRGDDSRTPAHPGRRRHEWMTGR